MWGLPRRSIALIVGAVVVLAVTISLVFGNVASRYQRSMALDSATHLDELGAQIGRYIVHDANDKWQDAEVVRSKIVDSSTSDVSGALPLLKEIVTLRGYKDIYLYAADGGIVNSTGAAVGADTSSEMAYEAQTAGRYIRVVRSTVYFTSSVETGLTLNGSPVVAVSIVSDLSSLLDDLNVQAFDGQTSVLLAQSNGLIISQTGSAAKGTLNVSTLFSSGSTTAITGDASSISDAVDKGVSATFFYSEGGVGKYVVCMPVEVEESGWRMVLIAPESAVNQSFASYPAFLSLLAILMTIAVGVTMAAVMYRLFKERLKGYREIASREQMLNLLISNTKTVFSLVEPGRERPVFVSSNVSEMLGPGFDGALDPESRNVPCYRVPEGRGAHEVATVNEELSRWDGTGEFTSSYLPVRIDGDVHYVVVRAYPAADGSGKFIMMVQDVTRDRERENAVRDALAAADEASRAKSAFLSNMSHDIRTPMNAIVNMTDFALASVGDNEEVADYLATIKTSSEHLLRLINEVLDMSRIESGKTSVEHDSFDVREKVSEVERIIRPLCQKRGQAFSCSCDVTHDEVAGDALKLSQILINLLNNAAKFTPDGGSVSLSVKEIRALRPGTAVFRFVVEDNGVGIAANDIDRIFAPFARIENEELPSVEGSGLGLSICKSFVEMMNGRIWVSSNAGAGSTFTVELPFDLVEASPKDEARSDAHAREGLAVASPTSDDVPTDLAGLRALLVEDNQINRQIARMLLERLGIEVIDAADGLQGVQIFVTSSAGTFDIIYSDVQMPVMNGYEMTAHIRASSHPQAATIPIVAMTANVFAEDVERAREAGMDAHVAKPLRMEDIVMATRQVLERGEGEHDA